MMMINSQLLLMDPQLFQCTGIWSQDPYVPASKLTAALNAQLAIPIIFEYSNGVLGKVFAPAGVSATVLNLHRGILNIFQLNLKNTQNVYELHEAGPHGVCKTHYKIREDEKTQQIAVTKSKDLNNCHESVIKDIGLAYAETCAECQEGTGISDSFEKFHKNQYLTLKRESMSGNIENLKNKAKFLGDAIPPEFAIVACAVRSNRTVGYLIAGYLDRSTARSQIVISSIADKVKWKMCADGVLASKHKLSAEVSWGKECQEYNVTFKAKAGVHDSNPALRVEVEWDRLPRLLYLVTSYVKWVSEYIPTYRASQKTGLSIERTDNNKREVAVIVALPTQRSFNMIVRAPQMTLAQMDVHLPVALPIEKDGRIPALQNVHIQSSIEKLDSDICARNRNAAMETLQKLMQQLQKVGENVLDEMEAAERCSSNSGNEQNPLGNTFVV